MKDKSIVQFKKICEVEDDSDRIKVATNLFSKGALSAKTLRMLWDTLDDLGKKSVVQEIYHCEDGKIVIENMRRCPPEILLSKTQRKRTGENEELCTTLYGDRLFWEYETSKVENKIEKFKKTLKLIKKWSNEDPYFLSAMQGKVFDSFLSRKCRWGTHDFSNLGLPGNLTFGVELEFVGVRKLEFQEMQDFISSFFNFVPSKQMNKYIFLQSWKAKEDGSTSEIKKIGFGKEKRRRNKTKASNSEERIVSGMECVSPILDDTENSWKSLECICQFVRLLGGRSNKSCGGHIHIGSNILGVDSNAWKNFLEIWREVEPILYLISNRRGENARKSVAEYADTLESTIDTNGLKSIRIKTSEDLKRFGEIYGKNRYKGLNLKNLYAKKGFECRPKNTIEFRIPNGNVNYDIIRENILLFGKILKIAKLRAVEPSIKKDEFEAMMEPCLEEKEKLSRFLNLIFDSENEKQIFRERWFYNSGSAEYITVRKRNYKKQWYSEKKFKIKEMERLSRSVSPQRQIEAMEMMIEDLKYEHENEREE